MPNTDWTRLNNLQLGKYAEYFAKMEFASYGLEVYTSEVDDRGIDFIVKDLQGRFCEIQVKALRGTGYVFMQKSKFNIDNRNLPGPRRSDGTFHEGRERAVPDGGEHAERRRESEARPRRRISLTAQH
jgi:hypothetical protein